MKAVILAAGKSPRRRTRVGRLLFLACWVVPLLNPAPTAFADTVKLADDVQIEKLQDGVWRHITVFNYPGFGLVPANGLIVAGATNAMLVDTGWTPDQTGKILDWIEGHLHRKIIGVIATHSHVDRLGGISEAQRRRLLTVSSSRTAGLARAAGLPIPEKTFAEFLELPVDSGLVMQLKYPGAGHTADNIVVWLPRQKILFGACLIKAAKDTSLGYTKDAHLDAWPKTIARLQKEFPDAKLVVPGHGDVGGTNLLSHTIALIQKAKPAR